MPQTLITMPEHVYDELKSRVKTLDMLAKGDLCSLSRRRSWRSIGHSQIF